MCRGYRMRPPAQHQHLRRTLRQLNFLTVAKIRNGDAVETQRKFSSETNTHTEDGGSKCAANRTRNYASQFEIKLPAVAEKQSLSAWPVAPYDMASFTELHRNERRRRSAATSRRGRVPILR